MMVIVAILQLCVVSTAIAAAPEQSSTLMRWSSTQAIQGTLVKVSEQGVVFQIGETILPQTIPWYDVQSIEPTDSRMAAYQGIADDAWRAHTRLARGDTIGAQEIYEQLKSDYLWKAGPQSADVSLGLTRCRIDSQRPVAAIQPMLSWYVSTMYDDADSIGEIEGFDPTYRVMVDLPPVFFGLRSVNTRVQLPESYPVDLRAISAIYQLAIETDVHQSAAAEDRLEEVRKLIQQVQGRPVGLELLFDMLVAQAHPDSSERSNARETLSRKVRSGSGTWIELWSRLGIGVSLLHENDTEANEQGVIELIHIIVRLKDTSRPIASLAAEIANDYFVRTGRASWGAQLILEARNINSSGRNMIEPKEKASND